MYFKEWCIKKFGISTINEGKIIPLTVLPTVGGNARLDSLAQYYGGYYVTTPISGIAFPKENFTRLCQYLDQEFARTSTYPPSDIMFQQNRNRYFSQLGVNATKQYNERLLPNIHLTFQTLQAKQEFMKKFANFYPRESFDVINNVYTVEMPPGFLSQLRDMYYDDQSINIYKRSEVDSLQEQLDHLQQLKDYILKNNLDSRLDKAQKLSLDYNNDDSINNAEYEASSAYALSLQVFAEANKDNLTQQEYTSLIYAANVLAAYDEQGNLKQSLKTDSNFTNYIARGIYFPFIASGSISTHKGWPLISSLPTNIQNQIFTLINDNTTNILHGHPKVSLGKNKYFKMLRFLPDAHGHSETDEIVFQAGGMHHHSAMFRVIKVGVLANGQQITDPAQTPHHYEYYKVESNLGAGCHDPDFRTKTCMGTYITKLEPFVLNDSQQLVPSATNPFTNPKKYQAEMEFTLRELISAERQLLFYRQPQLGQNGESSSIPGTPEAMEWTRLNNIKQLLSGRYYPYPLSYFTKDRVDPTKIYTTTVANQLGYLQEEGSCTIFSIKHLVHGLIGHELAALHSEFIQKNNGAEHLAVIDHKIRLLKQVLEPIEISIDSNSTQLWTDAFKRYMNITDPGPIKGIEIISSSQKGQNVIVIKDHDLKKRWYELLQQQKVQFLLDPKNYKNQIAGFTHYFTTGIIPDCQITPTMMTFYDPIIACLWEEYSKKSVLQKTPSNLSFFSNHPQGLFMLQNLSLAEANKIQSAAIAADLRTPNQYVIKLKFPDNGSAKIFAKAVESVTTNKPKVIITPENEVILGEKRSTMLFKSLNVNANKILRELPQETTSG
ncbi:TPA: hypothetical protein RJD49_000484, partial [Legionella pneumophila]|nr:hypothetical protein [Legionella pneumophila]HDV5804863.1 hypothetical protein [Legionella pneumophila]